MGRPRIASKILDRLIRKIAEGVWQPGTTVPASRRLATEFGVSLTIIQAALRRAADYKLLDVVHQRRPMVVRPGAVDRAQRLLARPSARPVGRRVAILVPDDCLPLAKRNPLISLMVNAMTREAERKKMQATLVGWAPREQVAVAGSLARKGFDAAIVLGFEP
ncbi:MAG: GntR family transcriptional regulator, partial [Anaerolineaceae bacterium]|nr:GntR family transcriptional regulator [Anaerolineaceae bacterium]